MKQQKKISDYFVRDDDSIRYNRISKHDDNAYKRLDMDILDLSRFIEWIEEEMWEEERKYEFNPDDKQAEQVEVIRYSQLQALKMQHERLMKQLWDYFYDKELLDEKEDEE
jgi:hypothetical protein